MQKPTAVAVVLSLAMAAGATDAAAQGAASYPAKVVRFVNPVAPGGNQEIVARAIAEPLSEEFAAFLRKQVTEFAKLAAEVGIKAN